MLWAWRRAMAKESAAAASTGPFGALKNIAATFIGTLQTRLALLGNEIQVEKHLILQQLGLGLALMFCVGVGLLLIIALAVHIWWEQRVWVLAGCAALFICLAVYLYAALRRTLDTGDDMFAASLVELQEDLRQLKAATGQDGSHG